MNLFRKLSRIFSLGRDDTEVDPADVDVPDVEQAASKFSQTDVHQKPVATEPGDDYDPTVPNLTIIDEASVIPGESEGFDPYDTIGGTSKTDLLKDS